MKQSNEPSPFWITGILLLLAISIIGIMLYVKIVIDKTQPEIGNTTADTASDAPAQNSPTPTSTTSSPDTKAADQALSSVDADLKAYDTESAEINASIDDAQGDLSE